MDRFINLFTWEKHSLIALNVFFIFWLYIYTEKITYGSISSKGLIAYMMLSVGISFLFALSFQKASKRLRFIAPTFVFILCLVFYSIPIVYLIYFYTFKVQITPDVLSAIFQTSVREALDFIGDYIAFKWLVLILIGSALLSFGLYRKEKFEPENIESLLSQEKIKTIVIRMACHGHEHSERNPMQKKINTVLVIGLGKVGALVAHLLNEHGYRVTGLDRDAHPGLPFKSVVGNVEDVEVVRRHLENNQAVVTCLPWHKNLSVARIAHAAGCHYFDLTEDISTTAEIRKLSETAKAVMAPQCGLAPGFVGIVGADLTKSFESLRSVELRVGALPQHPRGMLGYAFNWSPAGVVNEYLNDCEVIKDGKRAKIPPMEDLETIVIEGVQLEAFTTSGGLGTMCETFDNRVEHLNYKTIRYPGHCQLMRFFFNELFMKEKRELAGKILVNAKPPVNDDVVYIHAAVEGWKEDNLFRDELVRSYYPREIAGAIWKAISWTTSASVCAVLEMVSEGDLPAQGFLKQEEVPLDLFLKTRTGSLFEKNQGTA